MEGVQFQEEQQGTSPVPAARPSLFMRLAYASGFAKTEEEANRVLLVAAVLIAILAFAVAALFLRGSRGGPALAPTDPSWPQPVR